MTRKQKKRKAKLMAKNHQMFYATADIQFIEAAEGEENKLPTFKINAYNGGVMNVGYYGNIVVNLAGMRLPKNAMPVFKDHDPTQIVGHGTPVIEGATLDVEGVVSGAGDAAAEVTASGKNGFPWQASLGATPIRIIELSEGDTKEVNGQEVSGPVSIIDKSVLNETSFVPLGADGTTSAKVAAKSNNGGNDMDFAKWVEAKGFDSESLTEDQEESLKAMYDAEIAAAGDGKPEPKTVVADNGSSEAIAAINARLDAQEKASKIRELFGDDNQELCAKAIAEDWTVEAAQAKLIEAIKAKSANVEVVLGQEDRDKKVEAFASHLMIRAGGDMYYDMTDEEKQLGNSVPFMRLEGLCAQALALEGKAVPTGRNKMVQAAFSTAIIPNVINNVATKAAMKGFNAIPTTSMQFCNITSPTDYKVNERTRLDDNVSLDTVEYGNEVKDGDLKDTKESYKVVRYAKKITLEEMDIINDDLSLLSRIPQKMGGRAKAKIDEIVYGILTTNANMSDGAALFVSGHANLNTSTSLTEANLATSLTAMMKQTNRAGDYIQMMPKYLIVPVDLQWTAARILGSVKNISGVTTPQGELNVVAGSVEPIASRDLSANSTTTWYLSADPMINDTIELGFLDGRREPTIATERTNLDLFGFTTRIRFDFGAKALDWRGLQQNTA